MQGNRRVKRGTCTGVADDAQQQMCNNGRSGETASDVARLPSQIDAGCILWDLSVMEDQARFMVQHRLCDIIGGLLEAELPHAQAFSAGPSSEQDGDIMLQRHRLVEIACGMLANVSAVADVKPDIIGNGRLANVVMSTFLRSSDPPTLTELCRLLSTITLAIGSEADAEGWMSNMLGPQVLHKLAFIVCNTLQPMLLARVR